MLFCNNYPLDSIRLQNSIIDISKSFVGFGFMELNSFDKCRRFIMTTSRKRHCYSPPAFYSLHLHINGHHSTFYKCNKLKQRFSEIAQTEIEDNKKNLHKPLLLSFQSNKNTPAKPNSTHKTTDMRKVHVCPCLSVHEHR